MWKGWMDGGERATLGGWVAAGQSWGFSPTQYNINTQKTQKAPTPQPSYYSAPDNFFFGGNVTHELFFKKINLFQC